MSRVDPRAPSASTVYDELARAGITHVVGVPDNSSSALFDLLARRGELSSLKVTREGEAFAVASGLWMGGASPAVLIQNTGLLESGDSLRGTAMRMGVPLLCLVTYRGHATIDGRELSDDAMTRADVDSVAVVTEPTLEAWRIPYGLIRSESEVVLLRRAFTRAREASQPVVMLLARALIAS